MQDKAPLAPSDKPSPLLFVPLGADASPCDLLHQQPIPRVDAQAAAEALTFAFASGDGDVFARLLDHTPVAPSLFVPEDFARDLQLEPFVRQCFSVTARGRRRPASVPYLMRVLSNPPWERSHVYFRQQVCAELASSEPLCERLEELYVLIRQLRDRISRPSVGRQEGIDRRLGILEGVKEVVECLNDGFSGTTSGLSRLSDFGRSIGEGSGYRRLCELLAYEQNRAEIDLRVRVGFDGRIRSFQTLERRPNRSSAFYSTPLGRAWTWARLILGGYRASSAEILSRLIDSVFADLEAHVVFLFQLIGDLEVYLAALSFRRAAREAGLSVCLPEFHDGGARQLEGLFNPWLVSEGRPCTPCDLQIGGEQHLTFITGPNSGGKTRLLQSLAYCQLLGQCGLFAPAAQADLQWTNGLFASLIEHAEVHQVEGRLGTELVRIRRLFERSRVGGMLVLDELCSGTNPSEGEALIELVLEVLVELQPQGFVTTHFLEFAARLQRSSHGYRFLQASLDDQEQPTFAFADGVAVTSLAHRVAERLGVTRECLRELVRRANAPAGSACAVPAASHDVQSNGISPTQHAPSWYPQA